MTTVPPLDILEKYITQGESRQVITLLEPLLDNESLTLPYQLSLLWAYVYSNEPDKANRIISGLKQDVSSDDKLRSELSLAEALVSITLGDLGTAQSHLDDLFRMLGVGNVDVVEDRVKDLLLTTHRLQAHIDHIQGRNEKAIEELTQAFNQMENAVKPYTALKTSELLGMINGFAGRYHQAIQHFKGSFKIGVEVGNKKSQVTSLNNLGVAYEALAQYDLAHDYYSKARRFARDFQDSHQFILASSNLGNLELSLGNVFEAEDLLESAYEEALKMGNKRSQAMAMNYLVQLLVFKGDYAKARELGNACLSLTDEIKHPYVKRSLQTSLAVIKARLGDLSEAISDISHVISSCEESKSYHNIESYFISCVEWCLEDGAVDTAQSFYDQFHSYGAKQDNLILKKQLQYLEAQILVAKDNLGMARDCFLDFLQFSESNDLLIQQTRASLKLAQIALTVALWKDTPAQTKLAMQHLMTAIELSERTKDLRSMVEALVGKGSLEMALANYPQAKETFEQTLKLTRLKGYKPMEMLVARRLEEVNALVEESLGTRSVGVSPISISVKNALQGLSEVLGAKDPLISAEEGRIITNILLYAWEEVGPDLKFAEEPIDEVIALSSGVFLYTAVGQGSNYRTGLYGPIPFGEDVALVFSALVKDSGGEDPRLKNQNFVLVAMILKEGTSHLLERSYISTVLEEFLSTIADFRKFTEPDFQRLVGLVRTPP